MRLEDAVREIDDRFFKEGEAGDAKNDISEILENFFDKKELDTTSENVIGFLRNIWERFSIGKYVEVFVDFAKAEKALYGFGENYRDHLMHVFNVHLMGLLVFSGILKQKENKSFELLKIREESKVIPFPRKYDKPQRLYYLWSLISTFHDIAIPIDYRKQLISGFGRYLEYFKIEAGESYLKFPFMTQSDIARYSDLMSRLFAGGLSLSHKNSQRTYDMEKEDTSSYLYFRSILAGIMNNYDHGVLGAYFLFKSIEETFLYGKQPNPKYDLDLCSITRNNVKIHLPPKKEKWNELPPEFREREGLGENEYGDLQRTYDLTRGETRDYNDYVFEQDVARAALAIALHNVNPDETPKIFPLRFSNFPLACLLILLDELQEYYRPEELELTEVVRCRKFPDIHVDVKFQDGKPRIQMKACFDLVRPARKTQEKLVNKYKERARKNIDGVEEKASIKDYDGLVHCTWRHIFQILRKKIAFEAEEPLEILVKVTLEGKKPNGKTLEYQSPNWTGS
jgi:hypothetical protein